MKPRVTGNIRVLGWRPHHAQGGKDPHFKGFFLWGEGVGMEKGRAASPGWRPGLEAPSPSPALLFPKPPRRVHLGRVRPLLLPDESAAVQSWR